MFVALPVEVIDHILVLLGTSLDHPRNAFHFATHLRRSNVQLALLHRIPELSIDNASANNWLSILELHRLSTRTPTYTRAALTLASEHGHVAVLEWWLARGFRPFKYDSGAVGLASSQGHVSVLDWWHHSGLPFKYTAHALESASANGHIHVLNWFLDSAYEPKYRTFAIHLASAAGRSDVLRWWKSSGLELKYGCFAMDWASSNGHVRVLEWWVKESGEKLKWSEEAVGQAVVNGESGVVRWWGASGLRVKVRKAVWEWGLREGSAEMREAMGTVGSVVFERAEREMGQEVPLGVVGLPSLEHREMMRELTQVISKTSA